MSFPRLTLLLPVAALALAACGSGGSGSGGSGATPRPPGAPAAHATAWPEAFSTAAHTSATTATGPATAKVRWTRKLEGPVNAGVAVGIDGSLLAASDGGVLHALDPTSGADRWTYDGAGRFGGDDLSVTPAVLADGTVLWPAPGNQLVALTSAGKRLWSLPMKGFVLSPALGSGGRVYVADMSGRMVALDTGADGQHSVAWTIQTGAQSFGSPAVAPDGTIYTTAGSTLYAIVDQGSKAAIRWRYAAPGQVEVSPAVASDGTIILGTNAGVEDGITPAGTVRWSYKTGTQSYSSAVVTGGKAYFGDNNGYLTVTDAASGAELSRVQGLSPSQGKTPDGVGIWTAPLVDAAGDVYVATSAGHIDGYGPTGKPLWDLATGGVDASYPALTANGLLVLGSGTGTLYAIG